eukprot:scaffold4058_cov121-Isochrysis_galbana.AAC.8
MSVTPNAGMATSTRGAVGAPSATPSRSPPGLRAPPCVTPSPASSVARTQPTSLEKTGPVPPCPSMPSSPVPRRAIVENAPSRTSLAPLPKGGASASCAYAFPNNKQCNATPCR